MKKKKSLKRIATETGIVGILAFASGWAISKIIFDSVNPNDSNNNLYSAMVGICSGTALAVTSSGLNINWVYNK